MAWDPIDRGTHWQVRWDHPDLDKRERHQQRTFDYVGDTERNQQLVEAKACSRWITKVRGNRILDTDPLFDGRAYIVGVERATELVAKGRTFLVVMEEYLEANRTEHKPRTQDNYRYTATNHLADWTMPIAEIDRATLDRKYTAIIDSGLMPSSAKIHINRAKAVLSYAYGEGYTAFSVRETRDQFIFNKKSAREAQESPGHPVLDPEEFALLLAEAPSDQDRDIVLTLISSGARINELMAMTVGSVDYKRSKLYFAAQMRNAVREKGTKTDRKGKAFIVLDEMSHEILPLYTEGREWTDPLFPRPDGGKGSGHWTGDYWRKEVWKPMVKRMIAKGYLRHLSDDEIRLMGPHTLRATMCTWMLDNGVSPTVVMDRMRHAKIETTMSYRRRTAYSLQLEGDGINSTLRRFLGRKSDGDDGSAGVLAKVA